MEPSSQGSRTLELNIACDPEQPATQIEVFTRLNNELWTPLKAQDGKAVLRFPASGNYTVEVTGFRLGGRLKDTARFDVNVKVQIPDTVLTSPITEPLLLRMHQWQPPVSITKTSDYASSRLLWRIEGGYWQPLTEDEIMSLIDFMPGIYTLEFCAEEEEFWRDPSPVRIRVKVDPDYPRIISDLRRDRSSQDRVIRDRANSAIEKLRRKGIQVDY